MNNTTNQPWQNKPHPEHPLELKDLNMPIDLSTLFDVETKDLENIPVELEIGCGNGRFLQQAAKLRPNHLFIGAERARKYSRKTIERLNKNKIYNARILAVDATQLLPDFIQPQSIHALHVYFTDPWPKKRHGKRRLIQHSFLQSAHQVMQTNARLYLKVDLFWYFEEIACRIEKSGLFRIVANGLESERNRDLLEITGFEQKALANKGQTFWLVAEKF